MDIFGNVGSNPFDQALNTYDNVDFTRVDVTDAIVDNSQLATKLYVDTHGGGGGGGGNMNYVGTTPATNYIYKASTSNGHSAVKSNIVDTGATVTVITTLQCLALDGQIVGGNLNIGNNQATVTILADCIADKFVKSGGLSTQFLKANGDIDTNTYLTIGAATMSFSFSPNGDPLSQLGTANFLGASYTVQSFYNPTTFKVVSVNIYRTTVTANTSSVAIYTSSNIREGVATLIGSTATTLSYVFSSPITLTGNAYYYCAIQSSATSGIYAGTTTGTAVINSGLNPSISFNKVAFVGVTLPATLPTSGGSLSSFIYPPFTMTGTTL